MSQKVWVTFYQIKNWIPYKQEIDFVRYLSRRDGLITSDSYPVYYIVHSNSNYRNKAEELIDQTIIRRFVYVPSPLSLVGILIAFVRAFFDLRKISATKYLIINNTFHQVQLHLLARLMGWRSVKIAGTFFGHISKGWKRSLMRCFEFLHFILAQVIIVLSPSGLQYVPKSFSSKTTYTIPNFYHDAPTRPEATSNTVSHRAVCLSRLEPEKNLLALVNAWTQTKEPWQLEIYGDGSLRRTLEETVKILQLEDRVHLYPAVAHAEVFETLKRHDVFVLTSLCEGLGIVYLEAMYMRVPAIGLDVPGVRDSLGENRGILLSPTDWQSKLGQALIKALDLKQSPSWQTATDEYLTKLFQDRRDLSEIVDGFCSVSRSDLA